MLFWSDMPKTKELAYRDWGDNLRLNKIGVYVFV